MQLQGCSREREREREERGNACMMMIRCHLFGTQRTGHRAKVRSKPSSPVVTSVRIVPAPDSDDPRAASSHCRRQWFSLHTYPPSYPYSYSYFRHKHTNTQTAGHQPRNSCTSDESPILVLARQPPNVDASCRGEQTSGNGPGQLSAWHYSTSWNKQTSWLAHVYGPRLLRTQVAPSPKRALTKQWCPEERKGM